MDLFRFVHGLGQPLLHSEKIKSDFYNNKEEEKPSKIESHYTHYRMKNDDDDKNYPHIYLEHCRYREMKKKEKKTRCISEEIVIANNNDESDESVD